jgi:hypothetical protein
LRVTENDARTWTLKIWVGPREARKQRRVNLTELQSRQHEAEELIRHDLIYQPTPADEDDRVAEPEAEELPRLFQWPR